MEKTPSPDELQSALVETLATSQLADVAVDLAEVTFDSLLSSVNTTWSYNSPARRSREYSSTASIPTLPTNGKKTCLHEAWERPMKLCWNFITSGGCPGFLAIGKEDMAMMLKIFTILLILHLIAVPASAGPAEDAALRKAAQNLDIVAVESALKNDADPNAATSTKRGITPLKMMTMGMISSSVENANSKALEIAKLLFSNGAKLNVFDHDILFFPISEGNVQLVSLLLDKGASPTAKVGGYTPTELAIKYSQQEVYDLLVSRGGVPVNERHAAQLALSDAASHADISGMESALKAGARINDADVTGRTALINALRTPIYNRGQAEAVWWLLDKGADPNVQGESGLSGVEGLPLHIFVVMNKDPLEGVAENPGARALAQETFTRLLKEGAKVSGMDSQRRTPLHLAAQGDNVKAAEILIREGARVMARDAQGRTPLGYAESASMIRLLKNNGATEN